jgi:hypothetical protein
MMSLSRDGLSRCLFAALAMLMYVSASYAYHIANIKYHLVVKALGCGCQEGFNANAVTYLFISTVSLMTGIMLSLSSSSLKYAAFLPLPIAALLLYLARFQIHYNEWL